MRTIDVLRQARALISDPERWTTKQYARAKDDSAAAPTSLHATSWCAVGAIAHVVGVDCPMFEDLGQEARDALVKHASGYCIPFVNDNRGHTAVIGMFDAAIAELEAEELEAIPVAEPARKKIPTLA